MYLIIYFLKNFFFCYCFIFMVNEDPMTPSESTQEYRTSGMSKLLCKKQVEFCTKSLNNEQLLSLNWTKLNQILVSICKSEVSLQFGLSASEE